MQNTPERSVLLITDLRSVLKQKDVTRASRAESPRFRSLPISKHPASGIIPSEPLQTSECESNPYEVSSAENNGKSKKNRENPKKDLLSVIAERRFPCQKRTDPEKGHPCFLNPLRHADQIGTGNLDALATSGNALANGVQLLRKIGNIPSHVDETFPRGNFIPIFIIHKTYVWNQSVPRTLFKFSYICFSISTLF